MGYNEKAFALGSRRSIIREIFEYSICGCSHSSKIRISLKGRFFGIFWLIVAHRRQPYVLRFTKKTLTSKSDSSLNALAKAHTLSRENTLRL